MHYRLLFSNICEIGKIPLDCAFEIKYFAMGVLKLCWVFVEFVLYKLTWRHQGLQG